MTQCYRHGEICFEKIKALPKGLTQSSQKELLVGSHGHPHSFDNGKLYLKVEDEYVFGYFVAKDTMLFHVEHGDKEVGGTKTAQLPNGTYRLRRQVEFVNDSLKQVID